MVEVSGGDGLWLSFDEFRSLGSRSRSKQLVIEMEGGGRWSRAAEIDDGWPEFMLSLSVYLKHPSIPLVILLVS